MEKHNLIIAITIVLACITIYQALTLAKDLDPDERKAIEIGRNRMLNGIGRIFGIGCINGLDLISGRLDLAGSLDLNKRKGLGISMKFGLMLLNISW
jgi:hypothetical protein